MDYSGTSIKEPTNKGYPFPIVVVDFNLQEEDNLSTENKMAGPKSVLYSEVSLYSHCYKNRPSGCLYNVYRSLSNWQHIFPFLPNHFKPT